MVINHWQRIFLVSLCLCVCVMMTAGSVLAAQVVPPLVNSAQEPISLAGQWQFYWGQLLSPTDFADSSGSAPKGDTIAVPSSWAGQVLRPDANGGQPLPSFGVATYRTQVVIPPNKVRTHTMLMIESIGSAYQIWVNGELVGGLGMVAPGNSTPDSQSETPQIYLNLINITPKTGQLDIVVQVSNYSFRESGIFGDIKIGQPNTIMSYVFNHYVLQDIWLIGAFLVVGLYHIMIYLFSRRDSELLWLAGGCLSVAFRALLLNKLLVHLMLPSMSWTLLMGIQFSLKFVTLFTYIQLIRILYRQDINETIHKVCSAVSLCFILYVMSVPPSIFTRTVSIQIFVIVAILSYYLGVVGYYLVSRNREGSRLNLLSMVFNIVAIVHDLYLYTHQLPSIQLLPYAILTTLLTQSLIISYRYTQFQQRNVQLAYELQDVNRNLEAKVIERTDALNVSNGQLVALTSQRSQLMANIAHDMGSPLVGAQLMLHVLNKDVLNIQEKQHAASMLTSQINHVKKMVDDLFRLSKLESRQLDFAWEEVAVHDLYVEISSYFVQMLQAQGRMLSIEHVAPNDIDASAMVRIDRQQIYRVVQNLIENAVKYSQDAQTPIELMSMVRQSIDSVPPHYEWYVEVVDYGIGIAPENVPLIFERFYTRNNRLQQAGSGLGLAICKEIIERHSGKIYARSEHGNGSTFIFTLPLMKYEV
jgi:signal transduction histidine kinase